MVVSIGDGCDSAGLNLRCNGHDERPFDMGSLGSRRDLALAKRYAEDLEAAGVKARTEFPYTRYGHVARIICNLAEDLDAGLIVMGSRGKSDLAAILVGSVTHKVLHLTDRPVLVAR
jgi:nucleotide-binding universal stress UspA family protein